MRYVMLATVGGSRPPILRGIEQYQPVHVVFICSKDTLSEAEAIAQQAGLRPGPFRPGEQSGTYSTARPVNPDDPVETYQAVLEEVGRIREQAPGCRVVINYTGGTKSMSAGAVLAAVDDGDCEVCVVTGYRPTPTVVQDGTERAYRVEVQYPLIKRYVRQALEYMGRFDYPAAEVLLARCPVANPGTPTSEQVRMLLQLARGLGAWDKFDHPGAQRLLGDARRWLGEQLLAQLGRCCKAVEALAQLQQGHGGQKPARIFFDPVYDLILNARRRGEQGRYDDGVARLYRALELYAQIALFNLPQPINTADVDLSLVPETLRAEFAALRQPDTGKVQIPLFKAYLLLEHLDHPVGRIFREWAERLKLLLAMRNYSLLAHGFTPVGKADFWQALERVEAFIQACDQAQRYRPGYAEMQQFPTTFPVDLNAVSLGS